MPTKHYNDVHTKMWRQHFSNKIKIRKKKKNSTKIIIRAVESIKLPMVHHLQPHYDDDYVRHHPMRPTVWHPFWYRNVNWQIEKMNELNDDVFALNTLQLRLS